MIKLQPHKHLERIEELLMKLDELYEFNTPKTPEEERVIKLRWEEHVAYVFDMQTRINMRQRATC